MPSPKEGNEGLKRSIGRYSSRSLMKYSHDALLLGFLATAHPIAIRAPRAYSSPHKTGLREATTSGNWSEAKSSLRNRDCCVAVVSGLESHMEVLQQVLADQGPAEIDLRSKIRISTDELAYKDCLAVRASVSPLKSNDEADKSDPCSLALVELARGVASLAEGRLESVIQDVFCRIVCASDYRAKDPPYHTDKAPLRGYVTLRGVGTEFMNRTCNPAEYLTLRTFGKGEPAKSLRQAEELSFIVMKGDYYDDGMTASGLTTLQGKFWTRASACVHRSPPGAGGRRVIVSFDLGDGDDDREWYQAGLKREWRSGMTQRKSHLVS